MKQTWDTDLYQGSHSFVWQLGQGLVDLLDPQPGESILDLGCGSGQLTQAIADRSATVIGMDSDAAMVEQAQRNFPTLTFQVTDARSFTLPQPVDAVFSNAVLHWIPAQDQPTVARQIWTALKPGGRFVAEFGGAGNMGQVLTALAAARTALGYGLASAEPWYFPTIGTYAQVLEAQGFELRFASLRDRPTPLDGEAGLANWLRMFAGRYLAGLSPEQWQAVVDQVTTTLRPRLYRQGQWWADYRRLCVMALKPAA
jgi:trans-aconitate methyltransferase